MEQLPESESTLRQMGKAIGIGSGVAFSVIAGGFIGYKLGKFINLEEIGLVLGLILGLVAALSGIMKTFSNSTQEKEKIKSRKLGPSCSLPIRQFVDGLHQLQNNSLH